MKQITGEELGGLLFSIHQHEYDLSDEAAFDDSGRIFYYEDDLLRLFKAIGLPEPKWGRVLDIDEYNLPKDESEIEQERVERVLENKKHG